jgi:hypothetical protein
MVEQRRDIYLHELAQQVESELKLKTSRHTLGRWLTQWGITRKKDRPRCRATASRRERTARQLV